MESSVALPITGGCNCGAVRYEVSEPLLGAVYCHCTRCQRRSGTAAACTALVSPGSFQLVSGDETLVRWNAGDGRDKVFCGTCGSAMFVQEPGSTEILGLRMGTFDGDPGVRPTARQFLDNAAVWEPIPEDGLVHFPGRRTGG